MPQTNVHIRERPTDDEIRRVCGWIGSKMTKRKTAACRRNGQIATAAYVAKHRKSAAAKRRAVAQMKLPPETPPDIKISP